MNRWELRLPRVQFSLRAMLVATAVLSLLLGMVGVPLATQWARRRDSARLVQRARSEIGTLAARPPVDVPQDQWRMAVDWTSYVLNEICQKSGPANLDVLNQLCNGLEDRTARKVDLTTLQWVWERFEQVVPDGEDLAFRFRDPRLLNAGPFTDDRLAGLWALDKCASLDLSGTQVTDAGLLQLAELDRLSNLNLNDTRITDAGLAHLHCLNSLSSVSLNRTEITDAGLPYLRRLEKLRYVLLEGTHVSDDGLPDLRKLTQLKYLGLGGTDFTPDGIEKLRQALPHCDVTY